MDRDSYVHINWHNLIKGSAMYFTKELFDTFDIEYDYTSLMQYNMWVSVKVSGESRSALDT